MCSIEHSVKWGKFAWFYERIPQRMKTVLVDFPVEVTYLEATIKSLVTLDDLGVTVKEEAESDAELQQKLNVALKMSVSDLNDLENMLTPEWMKSSLPVLLPSDVLYHMLRNHAKNLAAVRGDIFIASDYDFVFEVNRKLPYLTKESLLQQKLKNLCEGFVLKDAKEAPPKQEVVKVRRFTHSRYEKGGWNPESNAVLQDLKAKNLQDLVKKVKTILKGIDELLLTPLDEITQQAIDN